MNEQKVLIKVLRKVGREAFLRGYNAGRGDAVTGVDSYFNRPALVKEFNWLIRQELKKHA